MRWKTCCARAADATPHADTLTLAQEKSLMANPRLLLVAICCLGHWTLEQIIETYSLSEPECIGCWSNWTGWA